jgi:hypothetical protein
MTSLLLGFVLLFGTLAIIHLGRWLAHRQVRSRDKR